MEEQLLGKEISEEEVKRWLDFRKVKDKKREDSIDAIDVLVGAFSEGNLILEEDFHLIQKIQFPDGELKELKYKPRLKVKEIRDRIRNVKTTDAFGLINAYAAALTQVNSGVIDNLDSEDYKLTQSIVTFFL